MVQRIATNHVHFALANTHLNWFTRHTGQFFLVVVQIFVHNDINGHVLAWRKFGACLSQHDINKTS